MSFFEILAHPGAKKLDFESPLAPGWAPSDTQNHPSGTKMLTGSIRKTSAKRNLEPTCFQGCFRSAPGHHFLVPKTPIYSQPPNKKPLTIDATSISGFGRVPAGGDPF